MQPKYESNQAASMPQTNPNQESALQQLNEELAKAEESFETMRRSMPLVPNADYLGRMQAAASNIEQIKERIAALTSSASMSENTNASISKFTISPLAQPINGSVAVCSATFYNTLTVNGITINEGKNGLYVKMPQKRTKQGRFIDVAHPLSADGRRNINETLLTAYKSGVLKQEFEVAPPKKIAAQNAVKYPPEYGNSLARLDVVVGDMVVHNAKIIKGKDDVLRLSMPSYKTKDGNYTSICIPATKEAYAEFNDKALKEYNTEYVYRKLSDDDAAKLEQAGIKVQIHQNAKGENIAKIHPDDVSKVNQVIAPPANTFRK